MCPGTTVKIHILFKKDITYVLLQTEALYLHGWLTKNSGKRKVKKYKSILCRESCLDNQTSIWLVNHLVRASNSRSGGHEFEYPMRWELGALTKVERPLVQVCLQW